MTVSTKDPEFRVKEHNPFNGESPLDSLRESWVTPTPLFFARNHGSIPYLDPQLYRLTVTGLVERPLELSIFDLIQKFPSKTLAVTLECAGNRRDELAAHAPIPGELPWEAGAISNASWRGVPLAEVLAAAGVKPGAAHVELTGLDDVQRHGLIFGFGGSIPLEKARAPETLLAYEMNGEGLPPEHGFPLRLIVPGYVGARSVKWLKDIRVQRFTSKNYFYNRAYQLFPPGASAETVDWDSGIKLGELSVNAVICTPAQGAALSENPVNVEGYAFAGGGRRVERVDISTDGGRSWVSASLQSEASPWAWRFWSAQLELPAGEHEITCRAWDSAANTQPENIRDVWNFKGYMNNAWHRVKVSVKV